MSDASGQTGAGAAESPGGDRPSPKPSAGQDWSHTVGLSIGVLIWVVIIGAILYWVSDTVSSFIDEHLWVLVVGAGVAAVLPLVPAIRDALKAASASRLAGFLTFGVLPLVLVLLACIVLVDDPYRSVIVRLEFLFLVTLFPGALFYLFIASRRESLLNEFIGNLDRLGLLDRQPVTRVAGVRDEALSDEEDRPVEMTSLLGRFEMEDPASRDRRIRTYLERFEAIYGRLDDELVAEIVRSTARRGRGASTAPAEADSRRRDRVVWANMFSAATVVPIIGATVLIAIGWLVTLPPVVSEIGAPAEAMNVAAETPEARPGGAREEAPAEQDRGRLTADGEAPPAAGQGSFMTWFNAISPAGPQPVQFAFLGAYFFSIQMLFRRYVRRDLGANAYLAVALRIVLAVIGVWVAVEAVKALDAASVVGESSMLVLAFAIGAFPVIVWKLVASVVKKVPGMSRALPSLKSDLPLSRLNGLTVWHETRLEEEDVENIQNMATADVIGLMLHTRIPPERIIAWVDEAIFYLHLGADEIEQRDGLFCKELRPRGIRNASCLVAGYEAARARGAEQDFLAMADGTPNRLLTLLDTTATYPNLVLVRRWRRV